MEEKSNGILLSAIPYLGQQKILKVFTAESGLISLISKSNKQASLCSPFCLAEWVYRKSEKEIFSLADGTLIDPLPLLRTSYDALLAAGSIASDLLRSQLPLKQSALPYELAAAYLRKLGRSPHPKTLALSFRLKLLLHDGLLFLTPHCAECEAPATLLSQGESHCPLHAAGGISFSPQEWEILIHLSYSRQFSALEKVILPEKLWEKSEELFQERTK